MVSREFYSCEEHVDCVIDDFINLYEFFPELNYCEDLKHRCNYCESYAKYVLENS